MLVAIWIFK